MTRQNKGKLIIFSAPSGAGKTTLAKHVLAYFKNIHFSVSACSRKPRKGEKDGVDYYFISADEFRQKINQDQFIEWEEVYPDHFYGTLVTEVDKIRNKGEHVLFDVDVVGGLNIKKQFGDDALAIFVRPPSVEILIERLKARSTDTEEEINTRIQKAKFELSFEKKFDITIINDKLETAKKESIRVVSNFINQTGK